MNMMQNGKHFADPFTEEEKKAINELRELVKDEETVILKDDIVLYKFLKARNFKMNQAEEMLRKHIIVRKENQIDRILLDYKPLEVLEKYLPQSFLGFDKEGCPIRYSAAGNTDMKGIFKSASLLDTYKCVLHMIESDILKTKEQSIKLGKPVSQFTYIYNFENLTLLKATDKKSVDFFLFGASLFQDNYPERLKDIFIINAPFYFSIPFAIVKQVMASELISKIKIFGASGWQEELLKVIDEDVLPAFLGGNRTDPDGNPLCETFVNHGYMVPESYYTTATKEEFFSRPDVERVCVLKQSKEDVTVEVAHPKSTIEWEYGIKDKDIGFGLFYKEDTSDLSEIKELIPVHRVDPSCFTESGMFFCDKAGIYNVVFDNTYSWFTPKEIYYKVSVKCPGEVTTT